MTPTRLLNMTQRERGVLAYIKSYHAQHGYVPSLREIMAACGISSTSVVASLLDDLAERGAISRTRNQSRSYALAVTKDVTITTPDGHQLRLTHGMTLDEADRVALAQAVDKACAAIVGDA